MEERGIYNSAAGRFPSHLGGWWRPTAEPDGADYIHTGIESILAGVTKKIRANQESLHLELARLLRKAAAGEADTAFRVLLTHRE